MKKPIIQVNTNGMLSPTKVQKRGTSISFLAIPKATHGLPQSLMSASVTSEPVVRMIFPQVLTMFVWDPLGQMTYMSSSSDLAPSGMFVPSSALTSSIIERLRFLLKALDAAYGWRPVGKCLMPDALATLISAQCLS